MYTLLSLFLMLSTALTQVLPDNKGDRFDFSTLPSREGQAPIDPSSESTYGIPLVGVKDEGNQADVDTALGTVIQSYSIGQTEVTAEQYCTYLNAVATGSNYPLFYNEKMGTDPNVASIRRDVSGGLNGYSVIQDEQGDRGDFPIVYVTLYQAARFCNWLQNRDNPDIVGDALTEHGAYTLNGVSSGPIARNSRAT